MSWLCLGRSISRRLARLFTVLLLTSHSACIMPSDKLQVEAWSLLRSYLSLHPLHRHEHSLRTPQCTQTLFSTLIHQRMLSPDFSYRYSVSLLFISTVIFHSRNLCIFNLLYNVLKECSLVFHPKFLVR